MRADPSQDTALGCLVLNGSPPSPQSKMSPHCLGRCYQPPEYRAPKYHRQILTTDKAAEGDRRLRAKISEYLSPYRGGVKD
jgi:hypothetical protein